MKHESLMVSDIEKLKTFALDSPMRLSLDEELLAYVVQDPYHKSSFQERTSEFSNFLPTGSYAENHSCAVWVTNIKTKETYKLGSDEGIDWGPRWSPKGRYLAFYSDRTGVPQLWVWDKTKNKLRQISEKPISAVFGPEVPQWTSDGKHLIAKVRSEDMDISTYISPDISPKSINVWDTETYESLSLERSANTFAHLKGDLGVFDINTGEVSILTRGLYTVDMYLSPDNAAVAVVNLIGPGGLTDQVAVFELLLVPLDGTPVRRLATGIRQGSQIMSWSPDGKHLVYVHPDGLFLTSTQGDAQKNLTIDLSEHPRIFARPLWNPSGTSIYCVIDGDMWELATDGSSMRKHIEGLDRQVCGFVAKQDTHIVWQPEGEQSICIQTHDPETKKEGFYILNTEEAHAMCLFEEPLSISSLGRGFDLTTVGCDAQIFYRAEEATHPEEIWTLDIDTRKRTQVTDLNPHLCDLQFGEILLVESETADGQCLRSALMLPTNYEEGKRYPLVTWIYGGTDLSRNAYCFGFKLRDEINFQLLATRGFGVLAIDTPLKSHDPMIELSGLVLPLVDKVIKMGIADEDRLGIMGYSYGGYCTVGLITQTNRFKAAVCGGGAYNLTSFYGQLTKQGKSSGIGWAEDGQGRMNGSLWGHPQRYIDNSPIFHLDKIETAVLIYCGEGYNGFDYAQSGELFSGLRRLNKKATFVWYRGETHGLLQWKPENRVDCWERIIDWFEKHLS